MATNDFLPVAIDPAANVDSQANFVTSGYKQFGFQAGLAISDQFNKVWRQSSFVSAALAEFMLNQLNQNIQDNGNFSTFVTQLTAALKGGVSTTSAVTGGLHTYASADSGLLILRSNSGSAMVDTLPGTSPGVLSQAWKAVIANNDTSPLVLTVGTGVTLDGAASGTAAAFIYLGPNQRISVFCDGVNYWTTERPIRMKLGANTTLFVATTGSDAANHALLNTSPWLTMQNAANFIQNNIDLNSFTVTVSVADGAYTAGASLTSTVGEGNVIFQGDVATPSNCTVTSSTTPLFSLGGKATITGFKMSTTGSNINCIGIGLGTSLTIGAVEFGACSGSHLAVNGGACSVVFSSNYKISGNAGNHIILTFGGAGALISYGAITVTLTGTPAFSSAFAATSAPGMININGVTFSGAATGTRYLADNCGIINTGGGGANYLPGNSAGSTGTGGQYI